VHVIKNSPTEKVQKYGIEKNGRGWGSAVEVMLRGKKFITEERGAFVPQLCQLAE